MKQIVVTSAFFLFILFAAANTGLSQTILLGPRITGNMNIYNQTGLTGTWNGIGIGIGGTLDISFSKHIGLMANLTAFDMRNFSNSTTQNNVTSEESLTLSYLTIDPMFKLEFTGFYMVAGPSLAVKLGSSGQTTQTAAGQNPQTATVQLDTKGITFSIVTGAGYTFTLSPGSLYMGTDFLIYIPLSDTYNFPGTSNSILSLKLGASLKFVID